MKKTSNKILILVFVIIANTIYGQDCKYSKPNFTAGEQLTYRLYYNWKFVWIPAGEVVFNVSETRDHYVFEVDGKSYPSYDSFFKVRDHYIAEVDKETFKPSYFRRDILEGNYIRYDSIAFDHKTNSLIEYIGTSKDTLGEIVEHKYEDCIFDLITMIYKLRNRKIPEESFNTHLFFDKRPYSLDVKYLGVKEKKIKSSFKLKCRRYSPNLISGNVFTENSKMNIWVYDDQNNIPVLIESPLKVGSVKAVLINYHNLKYPTEIKFKN